MYVVVIHHMDDAGLMDEASFLFFWMRVIFLLIKNNRTKTEIDKDWSTKPTPNGQ